MVVRMMLQNLLELILLPFAYVGLTGLVTFIFGLLETRYILRRWTLFPAACVGRRRIAELAGGVVLYIAIQLPTLYYAFFVLEGGRRSTGEQIVLLGTNGLIFTACSCSLLCRLSRAREPLQQE